MIILDTILALFRDYKPLTFFGGLGMVLAFAAVVLGLVAGHALTSASPGWRLAASVVTIGAGLAGMLSIVIGLVLHTITRRSQELEYTLRVMAEELGAQHQLD